MSKSHEGRSCYFGRIVIAALSESPRSSRAFRYQDHLGVAIEKSGHRCLYLPNNRLSPGQRVQFVTALPPQTAGEAEILGTAAETCKDAPPDRSGITSYEFKVTKGVLATATLAFVIANSDRQPKQEREGVSADLDGDGKPVYFRACASSEGIHLTIWKGKPLRGERRFHYYYYLGYDLEPDCTNGDTRPD